MSVQRIILSVVLVVLMCSPAFALARGIGQWTPPRTTRGPDRSATVQTQDLLHQMGGMLEDMAARLQAGPMMPEQTQQLSEVMGRIAGMMQQLAGTMDSGRRDADTQRQLASLRTRLTEMQQRMRAMRAQ